MDIAKFSEKTEPLGILGLKVTKNDKRLTEHYWDEACRRNVYSVSKSFTSCAVGFAYRKGFCR